MTKHKKKQRQIFLLFFLLLLMLFQSLASADTWTNYDTQDFGLHTIANVNAAPAPSFPNPTNQTINVSIGTTTFNVTITDTEGDTFNWTIALSNGNTSSGNDATNGSKTCTIGLNYSTNYTVWVNATDGNSSTNTTYWFVTANPVVYTIYSTLDFGLRTTTNGNSPVVTTVTPANNSAGIQTAPTLSVTVNSLQGNQFNISWSTNATGTWTFWNDSCTNGTYNQTATFATSLETDYYWTVSINDTSGYWTNETYKFRTRTEANFSTVIDFGIHTMARGDAPAITSYDPANDSTDIILYSPLNITVVSYQGKTFNITWATNQSSWTQTNNTVTNGTYQQTATFANTTNTTYYWIVNITDIDGNTMSNTYHYTTGTYNWSNWSSTFEFSRINFEKPTNLISTRYGSTSLNLTWTKDTNATTTYIRRSNTTYPTLLTGTLIYNGSEEYYNDTGLGYGTHYYYSAWSYNSTQNLFTADYNTTHNYTLPNCITDFEVTDKTMFTVSLGWTKGTNGSYTFILMNATGFTNYPYDNTTGDIIYYNTGTSITIYGLEANTTYYFTGWAVNEESILSSENNMTANATTINGAGAPGNLTTETLDDTRIIMNWTKENISDSSVIYQSLTGMGGWTEVYNGSALTYTKTGLTPATHYYYRVYCYNGEEYSSTYNSSDNITLPSPPSGYIGILSGVNLVMMWTKGTGAIRTVIKNDTSAYPTLLTGNLTYNDTGITTTVPATTIDYFTAWSWCTVDGVELFSLPVNLLWGGLEINVYNESNVTEALTNYTVFIKNQNGSETYLNTSCNNPFRLDVTYVPHGANTIVQVSRTGYKTRIKYLDLYPNVWCLENFYLASETIPPGGDPGGGGGSSPNETFQPALYYIRIVESVETEYTTMDVPIQNAKVTFSRYINTTGQFETISVLLTDANGYVNLYLVPQVLYQVKIEATNYTTEISDYIPQPANIYGQTTEKWFRLNLDEDIVTPDIWYEDVHTNITVTFSPTDTRHTSMFTFYYNITSSDNKLQWFRMDVWWYNDTNKTFVLLSEQNDSTHPAGGSLHFAIPNVTGKYVFECYYKKIGYPEYELGQTGSLIQFFVKFNEALQNVPDYVWFIATIILMIVGMGFFLRYFGSGIATGFVGLGIFAMMLLIKGGDMAIPMAGGGTFSGWIIWAITFLIYLAICFLWSRI